MDENICYIDSLKNLIFYRVNAKMCFLFFYKRDKKIRVYKDMTYGEFYDKYYTIFMPSGITKERFMRANRYRRLVSGNVIRSGDHIVIPKKVNVQ